MKTIDDCPFMMETNGFEWIILRLPASNHVNYKLLSFSSHAIPEI